MLHRTLFLDLTKLKFHEFLKREFCCTYQIYKWHNPKSVVDFKNGHNCHVFLCKVA